MQSSREPDLRYVCFEGKQLRPVRRARVSPVAPWQAPASLPRRLEPDPPQGFARWILARAGLDVAAYRGEPLQRRVPACLRALKVDTVEAAQRFIERQPPLLRLAVDSLLIGVTQFARDTAVFDEVRRQVVPALAGRRRPARVWSAACSSGAELYSVAMLLDEADLLERATLVGTDCRANAIEEARRALYPSADVDRLPVAVKDRYFETAGDLYRPIERLRRRIRFSVSDLSQVVEPGPWDLILCRNVAIYMNVEPAQRMFARLAGILRPGGFLVVGKAERPPAGLRAVSRCIYRRIEGDHGAQ